ncbi:MAG: pilus assembly protein [Rhizobiaceae bacterium]
MIRKIRDYFRDKSGQFAVLTGLLMVPMIGAGGLAIDYGRHVAAKNHLQALADAASLGLASGKRLDETESRKEAEAMIAANNLIDWVHDVEISDIDSNDDFVDMRLSAYIRPTFMRVLGYETLPVQAYAKAERALMGSVEVSLILDNTWSMSETDKNGVSKISALKSAATQMVKELMTTEDGAIRIALVPYADYVNVGTQYRGKGWLSIPNDYTVAATEKVCTTQTTKSVCVEKAATYSCTTYTDGVPTQTTCGGGCTKYETQTVAPYQSCTGGAAAKNYTWYGCVGSRMTGTTRLDDQSPSVPYPGYLDTSQKCLNPIVPLTTDKSKLLKAVDAMIINIGSYKPATYIPAGVVWGLNTLSPKEPFDQGAEYDPENRKPRKVAVLMTDGENTLRFNSADGKHPALSSTAATAAKQLAQTNADTLSICSNMKKQNIEIYTVAFMVDDETAKTMLESCATDKNHYFDASDTSKLLEAFTAISKSLRVVRLAI